MESKYLQVSKLDAAKRQLEVAIRLYFYNGDPVAIHTLVGAAYNVIRDLNRRLGGKPMVVKEEMVERIKPEWRKEFRRQLNEAENFFKHADNDHDGFIEFDPHFTEVLLFDAINSYFRITGEDPPLIKVFRTWFVFHNRHLFFELPDYVTQLFDSQQGEIMSMGRSRYFNLALPAMSGM